jgi:hypothetical protein
MSGEVLLLGLIVTIEPLPIIGFILVLSTPNGPRKGLGYLLGWLLSLIGILVATADLGGTASHSSSTSSSGIAASIGYLLIGLALLLAGIRHHNHPKLGPTRQPGWMKKVDDIGFWGAAVLGCLLQPWGLVAAGGLKISQAHVGGATKVIDYLLFGLLCTASILAMEGFALSAPERAAERMGALRSWLDRHRNGTITGLLVVVGIWLLFQGAYGLASG